MPPKKKFQLLSDESRSRRLFQRGHGRNPAIVLDRPELFNSVYDVDEDVGNCGRKKTKKQPKKPINPVFLYEEDDAVSSDDEDAGKFAEIENDTITNNKVQQLKNQQDSEDDFSLEIYQNGVRMHVVDPTKGKVVPHNVQPLNRPSGEDEDGGCNFILGLQPGIPVRKPISKKMNEKERNIEKGPKLTGYQKFRKSILVDNIRKRNIPKPKINASFRVFDGCYPISERNNTKVNIEKEKEREAGKQEKNIDKRMSIFSYTPIRGTALQKSQNLGLSTFASSSSSVFSPLAHPEFASTPIEVDSKKSKSSRFSKLNGLPSLNFEAVNNESPISTVRHERTIQNDVENEHGLLSVSNIFDDLIVPTTSTTKDDHHSDVIEGSVHVEQSLPRQSIRKSAAPRVSRTSTSTAVEEEMEVDEEEENRPRSSHEGLSEHRSTRSRRVSSRKSISVDSESEDDGELEVFENEVKGDQKMSTSRAADCSLTEMMGSSDEEKYKRKRSKKTDSPRKETRVEESLCPAEGTTVTGNHEVLASCSTMVQMTGMETTVEPMVETLMIESDDDKENQQENLLEYGNDARNENQKPKGRQTIQPQQRQLQREARLSTLTTASSRRESLNSLLGEISLDDLGLSLDDCENRTAIDSEAPSRVESRAQTAMTIHLDDISELPFYLADIEGELEGLNDMAQLLHVVNQKEPMNWCEIPKSVFMAKNVKKLGEGSYGEVFATIYEGKSVAIKIVPFEPDPNNPVFDGHVNGGLMPSCSSVLPEVVVMKELTSLCDMNSKNSSPNFINLIASHVVQGNYPNGLLKAWDAFAKVKESLNDRPSEYASQKQCFITFVTENGGTDLEDFQVKSEEEIRSILIQLLLSLLVAEKELEFEHRDLHLGNVLIARIEDEKLSYKFNDVKVTAKTHGVKANIIDFTLSRIKKGITTVFQNLENDPDMFEGQGDAQFDVYRKMRENNKGDWRDFQPASNLLWVEYLANKMIEPPICPKKVLTVAKKKKLKELFVRLGQFKNCGETFTDADFYTGFYSGYLDHDN